MAEPLITRKPRVYLSDTLDRVLGRRDAKTPPTRLMYDGPRDVAAYKENGREFLGYFIDLADLTPSESVLDVGSGMGRKALPLTEYLDEEGSYHGLEIVKLGVKWCNRVIARDRPNWSFTWADVYNGLYNPEGATPPREYRFPFDDDVFDLVVLGSVFTHMLPADVERYLNEIARVTRPGGRTLISYFLVNDESRRLMDAGSSTITFRQNDGYWAAGGDVAEAATAYHEDRVIAAHSAVGLDLHRPIQYGSWCGRDEFVSYQDLVVGVRR
jgi:SAM-dependent methyltransferase